LIDDPQDQSGAEVVREALLSSQKALFKIARMRMPFGKYKGRLLIDLPESYLVWFSQKGFPKGSLGDMLKSVYEIKLNGLEYLIEPIKNSRPIPYLASGAQRHKK